jgi:hypothetical protein
LNFIAAQSIVDGEPRKRVDDREQKIKGKIKFLVYCRKTLLVFALPVKTGRVLLLTTGRRVKRHGARQHRTKSEARARFAGLH